MTQEECMHPRMIRNITPTGGSFNNITERCPDCGYENQVEKKFDFSNKESGLDPRIIEDEIRKQKDEQN